MIYEIHMHQIVFTVKNFQVQTVFNQKKCLIVMKQPKLIT